MIYHERRFSVDDVSQARDRKLVIIRPVCIRRSRDARSAVEADDNRVQPAEIDARRVPYAAALDAIERAGETLDAPLSATEPACIDDDDLVVDGFVDGEHSPFAAEILDRLDRIAAQNVGLEDATWIALVPVIGRQKEGRDAPGQEFARVVSGQAAAQLVVATPGALAHALRTPAHEPHLPTMRLRIVGRMHADGSIDVDPPRIEHRAAGAGAAHEIPWEVVAFDARGRESNRQRVRCCVPSAAGSFICMLPVTDDVDAVEIGRADGEQRHARFRVDRSASTGSSQHMRESRVRLARPDVREIIEDAELQRDGDGRWVMTWTYRNDRDAVGRFYVEVGSNDAWSPLGRPSVCQRRFEFPLARVRSQSERMQVRVIACEGWRLASAAVDVDVPPRGIIVRRAGRDLLWVDADEGASVDWSWKRHDARGRDGPTRVRVQTESESAPVLLLGRDFDGEVEATMRDAGGETSDRASVHARADDDECAAG